MDENIPPVQVPSPEPMNQPPVVPEVVPPVAPPQQVESSAAKVLSRLALVFLLLSIGGLGGFLLSKGNVFKKNVACTLEAKVCPDGTSVGRVLPFCEFAPCPGPVSTADPTANWKTYTNSEYGFQIKYPDSYQIVSDNYGWPKAIFMLYKGGQSYDLVIEIWDKESDYKSKYENLQTTLVVKEVAGKFITLLNMNNEPEVDQIIATFKFLEATPSASPQ
jgi:hypothetical protein